MSTEPTAYRLSDQVTIIDPNPQNHVVEHEDLYIYASLVAKTKGRTFLTQRPDGSIDADALDVTTVDLIVSDSGAREEDTTLPKNGKREYLSTNWTTIGGSQIDGADVVNRGDLEGFGITNVDIKMEGSYIPTVVIDFVDIRGATLFEQGSCSPYGLFFHLPYPIFELTVKGYYGKPVTYYLNLTKFNTKFNTQTGNFECRGEFIGWSYAFLADILMGYVRCSAYMDKQWGAQQILQDKYDETIEYYWDNGLYDENDYLNVGNTDSVYLQRDRDILQPFCREVGAGIVECYTITDLIRKARDIKYFLGQVKTDDKYVELGNLTTLRNIVLDMRSELQRLVRIIEEEHPNSFSEIKQSTAPTITTRDKYVFNGPPSAELVTQFEQFLGRPDILTPNSNIFGQITAVIPRAKKWKITKDNVFPSLCGGDYISLGSNTKDVTNGLTGCEDILTEQIGGRELKYGMFDIFDDTTNQKFQRGMLSTGTGEGLNYPDSNSDGDTYFIDFGYIEKIINEALNAIDSELSSRRTTVKEEIDAGVVKILGFRPTIRNVFTILTCNVEMFIQLLLNCSIDAEEHHQRNQEQLFNKFTNGGNDKLLELKNASPGQSLGEQPRIFSWPTYYQEKYATLTSYSDGKLETKEVFPGENPDFYNWPEVRFVEDFIKACEKLNKEDEELQDDRTGIPGYDNYTPINPLESKLYGDIQVKYRDPTSSTDASTIDERLIEIIAERMFVSLDFSYFDPIRLNILNIGMGHTIPRKDLFGRGANPSTAPSGTFESITEFNNRRLWFHPQYRNKEVLKNLARIDAQNLLSCIDDPQQLSQLDITTFQGTVDFLEDRIKEVLKQTTKTNSGEFRTEPNDNQPGQGWFNSEGIPETAGTIKPRSVFNFAFENLNILKDIEGFKSYSGEDEFASDYWAYFPESGKILLPGNGTVPQQLASERDPEIALYVHSDISKMKQEHLFRIFPEEDLDEQLSNTTNIQYNSETKDHLKELNESYAESLSDAFIDGSNHTGTFSSTETYKQSDKTKLLFFDGQNDRAKSLFIGLDVGYAPLSVRKDGVQNYQYDAPKYWGIPLYVCSANDRIGGSYMASWEYSTGQETFSMVFPFCQAAYLAHGNDFDEAAQYSLYWKWSNPFGEPNIQSILPQAYPLELPGYGVLRKANYYEVDGDEDEGSGRDNNGNVSSKRWFELVNSLTPRIVNDPNGSGDYTIAEWDKISADTDEDRTYSNSWIFDTFVQTPLWLDNINYWRQATALNSSLASNRPTRSESNYDWGNTEYKITGRGSLNTDRPLSSNNYELKSPFLSSQIRTFGRNKKFREDETFNTKKYSGEEIQNRNLAYLFLAGFKTAPFVSCGTKMSDNDASIASQIFVATTQQGNYNYIEEHYPKAILPFVKGPNLLKLPKAWVYGIGSVLWRWKSYMGSIYLAQTNTSSPVAIHSYYYRHPQLIEGDGTGNTPSGLDPLSQPGYPSKTDLNGGYSFDGAGMEGGYGRKNRNWCVDVDNTKSYTNLIYEFTNGLWTSPIKVSNYTQTSSFGPGTINQIGWKRALSRGFDQDDAYNSFTNFIPIKGGSRNVDGSLRMVAGTFFDYWGVYNSDALLSYRNPGSFLWEGTIFNDEYSKGPWYQRKYHFDANGLTNYSLPPTGSRGWFYIYGENMVGEKNNPADLSPRNAREAAMNSFYPLLWCPPWQHLYTEPINSKGGFGPVLKNDSEQGSQVCESKLTFIPYDHQFRDYVGNFGVLNSSTADYANYNLGGDALPSITEMSIPQSWLSTNASGENKDYNEYKGSVWYTRTLKSTVYGEDNLFNIEAGRYAEIIGLLPAFVKEKFVEIFENWVDSEFIDEWLPIVDPVNFQTEKGKQHQPNTVPDRRSDLLGRSYRYQGADVWGDSDQKGWGKILGYDSNDNWEEGYSESAFDPTGLTVPPNVGILALDSNNTSGNGNKIGELKTKLIDKSFYAIITTPKLFGLDISQARIGDDVSFDSDPSTGNSLQVPFVANKTLVREYLEAFKEEWNSPEGYEKRYQKLTDEAVSENDSILDDADIKLALYRSFKSINDKWISSTKDARTGKPKFFFNITDNGLNEGNTPLAAHFSYVNRVMSEIGNKSVIDILRIEKVKDNPKMSFYNLISDLLGENKFSFFPLPSFTNFTTVQLRNNPEEVAREMFSPYTNNVEKASGPNFICMYVGGTSRTVDLKPKPNCPIDVEDMNYNDDSMSLTEEDAASNQISYEYLSPEEPLAVDDKFGKRNDDKRIENNGITAFRVAYGIENQNMFKSVELDQTEFTETNESLMVIDRLATGGNPANRTQKGNNLHNVYLTRGYTCKVSSLGNMMIQPLQYFDLTNIPMFYGTYLITKVEHNIKPHHIDTNFTGTRQPIATVPIVEDVAVALNESLGRVDAIEGPNVLTGAGGVTGGGGGQGGNGANTNFNNTTTTSVGGVNYIDIGATDPSQYYNRRWKWCSNCSSKGDLSKGHWAPAGHWVDETEPMPPFDESKLEYITLHWTAGYRPVEQSDTLFKNGTHYHYKIDKDGTLFKVSDTTLQAIHAGNINQESIGISYVGGVENNRSATAYVRTVDDWNTEDLNLNGRDTFKSKKQFAAIVQACILAANEHPNIKYITSHHFVSSSKSDVGDAFPYDILLEKLREAGVNLTLKYSGTAPRGVTWTGDAPTPVTGDIDLSFVENATEQEVSNVNGSSVSTTYNPSQSLGTGVTPQNAIPSTGSVQNALKNAGKI